MNDKLLFHQYDVDFFPSVPHGHLNSNSSIKLDSYLGYTYETAINNKKLSRETRKFIASLWNNKRFREFALDSINYFINNNPMFIWRVNNPRKLPRFK